MCDGSTLSPRPDFDLRSARALPAPPVRLHVLVPPQHRVRDGARPQLCEGVRILVGAPVTAQPSRRSDAAPPGHGGGTPAGGQRPRRPAARPAATRSSASTLPRGTPGSNLQPREIGYARRNACIRLRDGGAMGSGNGRQVERRRLDRDGAVRIGFNWGPRGTAAGRLV